MQKQRRRSIRAAMPWIIAALFTGLCEWIVFSSEAFQSCISTPQNEGGEQNLIEGVAAIFVSGINRYRVCTGEFVHANGESIIAAFTVVLAYSTIGLWASTYRLWLAGEAQSEITREAADAAKVSADTLVSTSRAHLWMQRVILHGITKEGTDPRKISFSYIIMNVGHSPAFVYEVSITFSFGSLPDLPEYVTLPKEGFTFIAPNNGTGTSPAAPIPSADGGGQFTIAADLVERYRSGKVKIYVHGVIRYRDPISAAGYSAGYCYIIGFGKGDDSEGCSPTGGRTYWTYN